METIKIGELLTIMKRSWKIIVGVVIPIILLPLAVSAHSRECIGYFSFWETKGLMQMHDIEMRCAYVLCVMASYWVLEPIPIPATALLPIALLPLLGVLSTEQASTPYMKSANSLFFGGLLMAIAIEGSNLHKRVAFGVLLLVGSILNIIRCRIMFGLMVTTMFLSMWISNTATTAMMVPVVDAMVKELNSNNKSGSRRNTEENIMMSSRQQIVEDTTIDEKTEESLNQDYGVLRKALLLSVAYSANIGGTGTITGTGTNIYSKYGGKDIITFAKWILYAFPGALICVLLAWGFLYLIYIRKRFLALRLHMYKFIVQNSEIRLSYLNIFANKAEDSVKHVLKERYKQLGPLTFHELVVALLFLILVLLWFFRAPGFIPGWDSLIVVKVITANIDLSVIVSDGTPAMLIGVIMFIIPTNWEQFRTNSKDKVKTVLDWQMVHKRMPWGVFLLLGGGFSLAEATEKSKLSEWVSQQLSSLPIAHTAILVILLTIIAAFITEIASNVATASVILPIVNKTAIDMNVNPLLFLMPVTIAVSFAFMFPVATPPNAIVFEHLGMKPVEMMKPGIVMNIVCITVALIMIYSWGLVVFDLLQFPEWAQNSLNSTSLSSNH
ncbi:solute carrier family 13 member 3-like protein [Leptotrombidium deliense]|uniref:Solute carrier family 13 member 3-like protein n=1 Tax=Leptotrombidium deliense TaxID=299467 RepID=A0A443SWI8_9ACAR|nr:solute carrier family 13 member 3-like protein [Leptotrombidium deliense]